VYSVDGANPFVSMFTLNGVFGTSFPGVASTLTTPIDVAAAPDGSVYVVDGRRTTIAHFTATGGTLASVPLPAICVPIRVAFRPHNDVAPSASWGIASWDRAPRSPEMHTAPNQGRTS
jgi:streptogramin lyase